MAAFTTFSRESLERYLVMFGLGELSSYVPVNGGIENSNYFVTLRQEEEQSEFVLTIVEDLSFAEVPFFNKLLSTLHRSGLPVPAAKTTLDGMTSTIFCGKPALLVPRFSGVHIDSPSTGQCHAIGVFLGKTHTLLDGHKAKRANPYSGQWMLSAFERARHRLPDFQQQIIVQAISTYEEIQESELPRGLIHGDLFKDNALFEGGELSGVIDFYHACNDILLQDLAIAINDWCVDSDLTGSDQKSFDQKSSDQKTSLKIKADHQSAMLSGYNSQRALTTIETDYLTRMQFCSAARFALTRLESGDPPLKDPIQMLRLAEALSLSI